MSRGVYRPYYVAPPPPQVKALGILSRGGAIFNVTIDAVTTPVASLLRSTAKFFSIATERGSNNLKTPLMFSTTTFGPSTSATNYWYALCGGVGTAGNQYTTQATDRGTPVTAGTLSNLVVRCPVALSAGTSYAFTVMVNGAATGITCTVDSNGTIAVDNANTATVADGDYVSIRSVPTGTPESQTSGVQMALLHTSNGVNSGGMLSSFVGGVTSAGDSFTQFGRALNNAETTASSMDMPFPASGSISKMWVKLTAAPGVGINRTLTVVKNGVDTGLTVTINGTNTTGSVDLGGSPVSFTQGSDTVYIKSNTDGAAAAANITLACNWSPTNAGEIPLFGGSTGNLSTTITQYEFPQGQSGTITAEDTASIIAPIGFNYKYLRFTATNAPGAASSGKSWTAKLRVNAADSSATTTILETATTNTWTGTVGVVAWDRLSISTTPANTPTATSGHIKMSSVIVVTGAGAIASVFRGFAKVISAVTTSVPTLARVPDTAVTVTPIMIERSGSSGPSNTGTRYGIPIAGTQFGNPFQSNFDQGSVPFPAGTLANLRVECPVALTAGQSFAFTVMVNNVDTGITCTVTDTTNPAFDTTNSVYINDGDAVTLKSVPSGTPNAQTGVRWSMTHTVTGYRGVIHSGGNASVVSGTPSHSGFGTLLSSGGSVTSSTRWMPCGGTISKMWYKVSTAPGSGTSRTATVYKNGASTTLTIAISDTATTGSLDLGGSGVSFAEGDSVYVKFDTTSTVACVQSCAFDWVPTVDGDVPVFGGNNNSISSSATSYGSFSGQSPAVEATESNVPVLAPVAFDLKTFRTQYDNTPGTGKSRTVTVRKNEVDSGAIAVSTDSTTFAVWRGLPISFAAGDKLGVKHEPAGSPTFAGIASYSSVINNVAGSDVGNSNITFNKVIMATATGIATVVRSTVLAISVTTTSVAEVLKALILSQTISTTTTPVSSLVRQTGKLVSATTTSVPSLTRGISKAISAVTTPVATVVRAISKSIAIDTTSVASLVRSTGLIISTTTTSVASLVRSTIKSYLVETTAPATLVRSTAKSISVESTSVPSLVRSTLKTIAQSTTGVATVIVSRTYLKVVDATTTAVATLVRQTGKLVDAVSTPAATIVRAVAVIKTVASDGIATVIRSTAKTFSVTTTPVAAATALKTYLVDISVTTTAVASRVLSTLKTIAVDTTPVASLSRQTGRIISAVSTGTATLVRSVAKIISGSSTGQATVSHTSAKIIAATSTGVATLVRSTGKVIVAVTTPVGTVAKSVGHIITITTTGTVTLVRSVTKIISGSSTGEATVSRALSRVFDATSTGTATLVRSTAKMFDAVTTPVGTVFKSVGHIITVATTGTATLVIQTLKVLSVESLGVATLVRNNFRVINAVTTPVATIVRSTSKVISFTADTVATVVRSTSKTLSITSDGMATIVKGMLTVRAFTATSDGIASLVRSTGKVVQAATTPVATVTRQIAKIISAVTTAVPDMARVATMFRTISAETTPVATVSRAVGKVISIPVTGIAALSRQTSKAINATTTGVAAVYRLLWVTINATATGVASYAKTIGKVISTSTTAVASIIKIKLEAGASVIIRWFTVG